MKVSSRKFLIRMAVESSKPSWNFSTIESLCVHRKKCFSLSTTSLLQKGQKFSFINGERCFKSLGVGSVLVKQDVYPQIDSTTRT